MVALYTQHANLENVNIFFKKRNETAKPHTEFDLQYCFYMAKKIHQLIVINMIEKNVVMHCPVFHNSR